MSEEDDIAKLLAESTAGLSSLIPKDLSGEDRICHAEDALDFESEDELAEDEALIDNKKPPADVKSEGVLYQDTINEANNDFAAGAAHLKDCSDFDPLAHINGDVEIEGSFKPKRIREDPLFSISETRQNNTIMYDSSGHPAMNKAMLLSYYPNFTQHAILKMNTLFGPKPSSFNRFQPPPARVCVPTRIRLDVEADQKVNFKNTFQRFLSRPDVTEIRITKTATTTSAEEKLSETELDTSQKELDLVCSDWDEILQAADQGLEYSRSRHARIYNKSIYDDELEEAILDGTYQSSRKKPLLDMNDPNLLFVEMSRTNLPSRLPPVRYNISNDKAYDMLKENYQNKVRSTIGNLNIDHSLVALRLQSPYYKVRLSKTQMRSWHRPKFNVKPGTVISLQSLKIRKHKKDKGKPIQQLLSRSTDLTVGDNAPVFLTEYCEEFPLVLSNFGMGSKLINYYRKKNPEDTARPKLPLGETHVLDVQDRSAFWNFGYVEPGNVVPTFYNQMIRAPIFRHDPKNTDFILVRSVTKARGQKYFLRKIPYLFVVGQTFPVTLIPGPHSRKVTTASKNRLKMIVYRVLNKNERHRLQVKDISGHFLDQNDMQNRQRLKEFMEYQRSGADQGYWKIKQGDTLPDEATIRSMIAPEDIALLEAMQVGQQHLEDSGYGKTVEDDKDDQDVMSLEEQLAPWNVSRNFINAIQGKAMLQLHGDGDPTARGEGFSFLRTSMKGGFKAANETTDKIDKSKLGGHSYNVALQQKAYDEEIKRIWYAQAKSLQITDTSVLPAESRAPTASNTSKAAAAAAAVEAMTDSFDDGLGLGDNRKVLRIQRLVKDHNGTVVRKTELVTDPNVIRAYTKRRQQLEDAQMLPDEISVTNDEERNKRHRRLLEEELARLKRNQDRRMARRATKGDAANGQKVKSTTRKCATCGAVGHIKTNKSCPMYNDIYLGGQPRTKMEAPPITPNVL